MYDLYGEIMLDAAIFIRCRSRDGRIADSDWRNDQIVTPHHFHGGDAFIRGDRFALFRRTPIDAAQIYQMRARADRQGEIIQRLDHPGRLGGGVLRHQERGRNDRQ